MSSRHLRKVFGDSALPPPDHSDEEFEPNYAKATTNRFNFEIDENSNESEQAVSESEEEEPVQIVKKKNNKKKKNKGNKSNAHDAKPSKNGEDSEELDEVERSLREVNEMLGEVAVTAGSSKSVPVETAQVNSLLSINSKHLNAQNELKRMFGSEANVKKNGSRNNRVRLLKKPIIVPIEDYINLFKKVGLSMSVLKIDNGVIHFTFDHSPEYQKFHRTFLSVMRYKTMLNVMPFRVMQVEKRRIHVEGWLEYADVLFSMEEYTGAKMLLEQAIGYFQYVMHPSFNMTSTSIRLEYKYLENQPFHEAILKYLHLLTNKACHRTALELSKLLLTLDPSDPLAILLIIDALALRAREHQWLIQAIEQWNKERNAGYLYNMKYSNALAHFHVLSKNGDDISKATNLLRDALLFAPSILLPLLQAIGQNIDERLKQHKFFTTFADQTASRSLKELSIVYAKFTFTKWREQSVLDWLTNTAVQLVLDYDNDSGIQEKANEMSRIRLYLFQTVPTEIVRHLTIIRPMAALIGDNALTEVSIGASEPHPPAVTNLINRYKYNLANNQPPPSDTSPLYGFIRSLVPDTDMIEVPEEIAAIVRGERPPAEDGPQQVEDETYLAYLFDVIVNNLIPDNNDDEED